MATPGNSGSSGVGAFLARPRTLVALIALSVVLMNLAQSPGQVTFDSKLDLQLAPLDFLHRSLYLWNPAAVFGELQNQATGFLFPIGPVFLIGDLAGIPVWVWERLWSALVMLAAFEGTRRLARAWGGIGPYGAICAGLAYMLAPRVLTTVGSLTGETLPTAVLPWTVLPLVLFLRGRLRGRHAILLSATSVAWMGGQNATIVLAALVLPFLILMFGLPSLRSRLLYGGLWAGLVALACLWWLVPLLFLGRYSPPFLDYIESARNTTDHIGALAAFRGTDHWVAFLPGGSTSGWEAGYDLVSSPFLVLVTGGVATIGLLGLLSPEVRMRPALVASMLVGFFVLTAGSGGVSASILGGLWTDALDSFLAPIRNVHKFDPAFRLPLTLGVGIFVTNRWPRWSSAASSSREVALQRGAVAAVVLVVLASAQPALAGHLRDDRGMKEVPHAWAAAATYLQDLPEPARILVLPGAGFGIQTWGRTVDEPIQVLGAPPWTTRNQTPLAPPGTIRVLDAIEGMLVAGRARPELTPLLERAGITHLVVRNDLAYDAVDSPRPEFVHAVLDNSDGLRRVESFGDARNGYPMVEVYRVGSDPGDPRARIWSLRDRVVAGEGAEITPSLLRNGLLDPDQVLLLAQKEQGASPDIVSDSNRRQERNFGRVHEAVSQVMTDGDSFRSSRARHDYSRSDTGAGQTVARYVGARSVTASSSVGYVDTFGPVLEEEGPYSAVDGSLLTSWVTSPLTSAQGQWIELDFGRPSTLGSLDLQFDVFRGVGIRSVLVQATGGDSVAQVDAGGAVLNLQLPPAPTKFLRITVQGVRGSASNQVRLADLRFKGRDITRTLVVPGRVGAETTVSLSGAVPRRACFHSPVGLRCGLDNQRQTQELDGFSRTIAVSESGDWDVSGAVVATGGSTVAELFAPLTRRQVSVSASSFFAGDPAVQPGNVFDREQLTGWLASPEDRHPVLELAWKGKRTISEVTPTLLSGSPGRLPRRIMVESDGDTQIVSLGELGLGFLDPVRTDHLRLTMLTDTGTAQPSRPVGISEIRIKGLQELRYRADLGAATGRRCGFGPTVRLAGQTVQTRVSGTLDDVVSGGPLAVVSCDDSVRMTPGTHAVEVENPSGFVVSDLTLSPSVQDGSSLKASPSSARVETWGPTSRTVDISSTDESALVVPESFNDGWMAELDGKVLRPVEIDGWMQGWRLPAGTSGVVRLSFSPQPMFVTSIVGGLALLAALNLLALVVLFRGWRGGRRRPEMPTALYGSEPHHLGHRLSSRALGLLALPLGLISLPLAIGYVAAVSVRGLSPRGWDLLCVGGLFASIGYAAITVDTTVRAPGLSDVLCATVVGIVLGRMVLVPSTRTSSAVSTKTAVGLTTTAGLTR